VSRGQVCTTEILGPLGRTSAAAALAELVGAGADGVVAGSAEALGDGARSEQAAATHPCSLRSGGA
jgi:hypothetical protein